MSDSTDRGRRVGKYEIVARLSVGGMAELFLACSPGPGGFQKFVALKQILPEVRSDAAVMQMFLDEARLTAALMHPNVGQVFDLGVDPVRGDPFLAMEFIAGQNLARLMRVLEQKAFQLPLPIACRIIHDVCLGLHAAHVLADASGKSLCVVHRDVTPRNVMVTYTGHVKVIDFGIARALGSLGRTLPGQVRGTLSYITPEQVLEHPLDARTDVFAAGTILYELLTGRRMHPNELAAPRAVVLEHPGPPSSFAEDIPPALDAAVLKALEKSPEHRFESARAFARALADAVPLAHEEDVAVLMEGLFSEQRMATAALLETLSSEGAEERTVSMLLAELVERSSSSDVQPQAVVLGSAAPTRQERALVPPARLTAAPVDFPERDEALDVTQIDRPAPRRGAVSLGADSPDHTRQVSAFQIPRRETPVPVVPPVAPSAPRPPAAWPPPSPPSPTLEMPVPRAAPSAPRPSASPAREAAAWPPPSPPSPTLEMPASPSAPRPSPFDALPLAPAPRAAPSGPRPGAASPGEAPTPRPPPSGPRPSTAALETGPAPAAAPSGPRPPPSGPRPSTATLEAEPTAARAAPSGPRPQAPASSEPPAPRPPPADPGAAPGTAAPSESGRPRRGLPASPEAPPSTDKQAWPSLDDDEPIDHGAVSLLTTSEKIRWVIALVLLTIAIGVVVAFVRHDLELRQKPPPAADAGVR